MTFMAAMTTYVSLKWDEFKKTGENANWSTPVDMQAGEYIEQMRRDNFISEEDWNEVLKAVSPGFALSMMGAERLDMPAAPTACEAHQRGDDLAPMSWEERR